MYEVIKKGRHPEFYWEIRQYKHSTSLYWSDGVANDWEEPFARKWRATERLQELILAVEQETGLSDWHYGHEPAMIDSTN